MSHLHFDRTIRADLGRRKVHAAIRRDGNRLLPAKPKRGRRHERIDLECHVGLQRIVGYRLHPRRLDLNKSGSVARTVEVVRAPSLRGRFIATRRRVFFPVRSRRAERAAKRIKRAWSSDHALFYFVDFSFEIFSKYEFLYKAIVSAVVCIIYLANKIICNTNIIIPK